jgi:peptide/nickel transport system ATP-binding protein
MTENARVLLDIRNLSNPEPTYARTEVGIKGGMSKPINPPPQCRFYPRCPIADDHRRDKDHPPLENKGGEHLVGCYKG